MLITEELSWSDFSGRRRSVGSDEERGKAEVADMQATIFMTHSFILNVRPRKVDYVFLIRWSVGFGSVLRFCRGAGSKLFLAIISYF